VIVDWYGCELKVGDGKCVNIWGCQGGEFGENGEWMWWKAW
jgi:hypothetical protein